MTINPTTNLHNENISIDEKTLREHEEDKLRSRDADLQQEAASLAAAEQVDTPIIAPVQHAPSSASATSSEQRVCPFAFVPLKLDGRTHKASSRSKRLVRDENVTLEDLQKVTDLFYEKVFKDATLDQFIRSHNDPHGERFAKWIHQKIGGSNAWDLDRLARGRHAFVHDRTSAHVAAWYSPKRPAHERGQHFQLDECRVWMRLHFWAMRESGLMEKAPSFCDYYVRFIGHFVNVYESSAPVFTRDSLRWSADPKNIETYIANGRRMVDVFGLSLEQAEEQIPHSEANDFVWPYNQVQA